MDNKDESLKFLEAFIQENRLIEALNNDAIKLFQAAPKTMAGFIDKGIVKQPKVRPVEIGKRLTILAKQVQKDIQKQQQRMEDRLESLLGIINFRKNRLEAYAKRKRTAIPAKDRKGKFLIVGQVIDEDTRMGLPGLTIDAFDKEHKFNDLLGQTQTDALGYYRFEYSNKGAQAELFKKRLSINIKVLDDNQKELYTPKKGFIITTDRAVSKDIAIDGSKVPQQMTLAKSTSIFVDNRIELINSRIGLLTNRKALTTGKIPLDIPPKHSTIKAKR